MTLTAPEAPLAALALVKEHVSLGSSVGPLQISRPYPVYNNSIHAFLAGKLLKFSKQTAWQYVITEGDKPRAVAEVAINRPGPDGLAFAALRSRGRAKAIVSAIAAAELLPEVVERNYELRLLRVPTLYLTLLWLLNPTGDLLLSVAPTPEKLPVNSVVSEATLHSAFFELASKRLSESDV